MTLRATARHRALPSRAVLTDDDRDLLLHLTSIVSVAGREERAIDAVRRWAAVRDDVHLETDPVGNLVVGTTTSADRPPLWVTAHLDHPGFVVTGPADDDGLVPVEFRGGVGRRYFEDADLAFFPDDADAVVARLVAFDHGARSGTARLDRSVPVGTLGRWAFDPDDLGIVDGLLRAPACDDLAGVAAALSVLDRARSDPDLGHVTVLLTRAEEVGFVGALGAVASGTIPTSARVVCLETSRAFDWAPIGAGPVVRVGDRVSVFSPALTGRLSAIADELDRPTQRKLMDGGACEATAFAANGFEATCLCLPLGNYHNQGDLDAVERGEGVAHPAPEVISLDDHEGLIELLVAAARHLDDPVPELAERLAKRYEEHRHLL